MSTEQERQEAGGFFQAADPCLSQVDEYEINAYVVKVFGWMFLGLAVTALTTGAIVWGMNRSADFVELVFAMLTFPWYLAVFGAQLGIVVFLSARVMKMNPGTAKFLFLLYSSITGLTVGLMAVLISLEIGGDMSLVTTAFALTAGSFGVMAVYGHFTKKDLTGWGSLLRMALFGLIAIMVVNLFLRDSQLDFLVSIVGLVIFLGLTASHTNAIKNQYARVALGSTEESRAMMGTSLDREQLGSNLAILAAFSLYLAFINIFIFILRLMSRR